MKVGITSYHVTRGDDGVYLSCRIALLSNEGAELFADGRKILFNPRVAGWKADLAQSLRDTIDQMITGYERRTAKADIENIITAVLAGYNG